MLILEELGPVVNLRKTKKITENLQHMIACTTYYITNAYKRLGRIDLSNYFNLVGRKLLGHKESNDEGGMETNYKASNVSRKSINKPPRSLECKALETHWARACSSSGLFPTQLTGGEDVAMIYAFIEQNDTISAYKDLNCLRKRADYFEILVVFLQKALAEDLHTNVNEFCEENFEWLQDRNVTIVGKKQQLSKKNIFAKLRTSVTSIDQEKPTFKGISKLKGKSKKIKNYALLIPENLDQTSKLELEYVQKTAINLIYTLFPVKHENWQRRIKLRRQFMEEAPFKAQFYVHWVNKLIFLGYI